MKPKKAKDSLTPKQQRFIAEYLIDLNGAQAAARAGYSAKSANDMAKQNLSNPAIAAEVAKRMAKRANKIELTADNVLREIARVALSDTRKLYREDGTLKRPDEWDDDTAAAVAGVEVLEEFEGRGESRELIGHTKKLKLWDKNAALDKAAKHLGLYERDNAQLMRPVSIKMVFE